MEDGGYDLTDPKVIGVIVIILTVVVLVIRRLRKKPQPISYRYVVLYSPSALSSSGCLSNHNKISGPFSSPESRQQQQRLPNRFVLLLFWMGILSFLTRWHVG
jgi:hypothetical protein